MESEVLTTAMVTGALLPILIAVGQQQEWSKTTRTLVAVATAAVSGILVAVTNGNHDAGSIITSIITTIIATTATYQGVWQPAGVAGRVEAATSPPFHRG